jgi:hypothetical protein
MHAIGLLRLQGDQRRTAADAEAAAEAAAAVSPEEAANNT